VRTRTVSAARRYHNPSSTSDAVAPRFAIDERGALGISNLHHPAAFWCWSGASTAEEWTAKQAARLNSHDSTVPNGVPLYECPLPTAIESLLSWLWPSWSTMTCPWLMGSSPAG
jgi:hypothetical protein